jgi:hypothetical protein
MPIKKYKPKSTKDKDFWTVKETAQEFSISQEQVYKQVKAGLIETAGFQFLGNRILIPKDQFNKPYFSNGENSE